MNVADTGDLFAGQADTIGGFASNDTVLVAPHSAGAWGFLYGTDEPPEGFAAVWTDDSGRTILTFNSPDDGGWHDIVFLGEVYFTDGDLATVGYGSLPPPALNPV